MKTEFADLAREIVREEARTWLDALLYARSLVDELHEYAAQWDAAQAHDRAAVEGWCSAIEAATSGSAMGRP
jgi:hypothetical protein